MPKNQSSGQVKKLTESSRFGLGSATGNVCVAAKPRTFRIPTFGIVDIQPDGMIQITALPSAQDVICTIGRSKNRASIGLL